MDPDTAEVQQATSHIIKATLLFAALAACQRLGTEPLNTSSNSVDSKKKWYPTTNVHLQKRRRKKFTSLSTMAPTGVQEKY